MQKLIDDLCNRLARVNRQLEVYSSDAKPWESPYFRELNARKELLEDLVNTYSIWATLELLEQN